MDDLQRHWLDVIAHALEDVFTASGEQDEAFVAASEALDKLRASLEPL